MKRASLCLTLLSAMPLVATPCIPLSVGKWEISVEALYLKPSLCGLDYAIQDPRQFNAAEGSVELPQGKACALLPKSTWGARFMAGWIHSGCSEDITFAYTYLHSRKRRKGFGLQGPTQFWPTATHFGSALHGPLLGDKSLEATAETQGRFYLDRLDLEIGARSCQRNRLHLRSFVELLWARLEEQLFTFYFGRTLDEQPLFIDTWSCGKVWGVGLGAGLEGALDIGCNLSFTFKLGAGLLQGRSQGFSHERVIEELLTQLRDVTYHPRHHLFTEWQGRLGLSYRWCYSPTVTLFFEVGGEWDAYINALPNHHSSGHSCESFNLDGIYLRGLILF